MMSAGVFSTYSSLGALLAGLADTGSFDDTEIVSLTLDSREVQKGFLFVALPGRSVDGRNFIDTAIEAGAAAVIWDCEQDAEPIPVAWRSNSAGEKIPVIAVKGLSSKIGTIADRFYQSPSKQMNVIGITGTNGKTSCSHFIAQALSIEEPAGVIGTLGWGELNNLHVSTHTTPDVITCHQWLWRMHIAGVRTVAMEVSSHALDQGRVDEVLFDRVVFTNLSHDHLDYHGDLASYAEAKAKLFFRKGVRAAVINIDDQYGNRLAQRIRDDVRVLRYGLENDKSNPDIYAAGVVQTEEGLQFHLCTPIGNATVKCSVYGLFNVYNILATAGILLLHGYSLHDIKQQLQKLQTVNGRFTVMRNKQNATVVIDYAHTPDALEQSLLTVQQHFKQPVWCVFGCGGDRDKDKRPQMGAIAEKYAEHVIVTSDNPRNESAMAIIDEITGGMKNAEKAEVKADRREAIHYALANAAKTDVILIAGKGHESYQQIGTTKYPFNDAQVVREYSETAANE